MGEAPIEGPAPDTVASLFTNVYYTLAAQQPHRLAELYGTDSQLSHEPGIVATGLTDIAAEVQSLPCCKDAPAEIRTVDAMHTGRGGYLVVVTGSIQGAMFVQTFLLDPTLNDDSRKHFYCRNDLFRFLAPANTNATSTGDVLLPTQAKPVQVTNGAAPCGANSETETGLETPCSGVLELSKTILEVEDSAAPQNLDATERDVECIGEDQDDAKDSNNVMDGVVVSEEAMGDQEPVVTENTAVESSGSENIPHLSESTVGQSSSLMDADVDDGTAEQNDQKSLFHDTSLTIVQGLENLGTDLEGQSETVNSSQPGSVGVETAAHKSPAPKSWASVVLSSAVTGIVDVQNTSPVPSVGAPNTSVAATSTGMEGALSGTSDSPVSPLDDSRGSIVDVNQLRSSTSILPHNSSEVSNEISLGSDHAESGSGHTSRGAWNSVESKGNYHRSESGTGFKFVGRPNDSHNHQNDQSHHHYGAGGPYQNKNSIHHRVFGPSAVIQLANLPVDRLRDWRTLVDDFSKEFAGYGYEVRHVDVKASKGLAFVEYENMDGVRAAVNAWADGPRQAGPFKGLMLMVSEKRQHRWHYQNRDRGGGAGGRGMAYRGGGRGNASRGRGRGSSFGGGPGPNLSAHPGSTPTPAST